MTRVWTDPLPSAEVERVAPNEDAEFKAQVTFGMEALAQLAEGDGAGLRVALADLPVLYGTWIDAERKKLAGLPARRGETGERLIAEMETAKKRIANGHRDPRNGRQGPHGVPLHESLRFHGRTPSCRRRGRRSEALSTNRNGGRSSSPLCCSTWPA